MHKSGLNVSWDSHSLLNVMRRAAEVKGVSSDEENRENLKSQMNFVFLNSVKNVGNLISEYSK